MTTKNTLQDILLRPAQTAIDRGVARSTTAAALAARLEGKSLQIDTGAAGLAAYLRVTEGRLLLESGQLESPDARLHGSPINLLRMAGDDPEQIVRAGRVHMSGDADIAADYQALLELIRPDWEEALSRITSDAIAHEAGRVVSDMVNWGKAARHTLGRSLAEYLTEERRDLASTTEIEEFCAGVDQVSVGVDRIEARMQQLRLRFNADHQYGNAE